MTLNPPRRVRLVLYLLTVLGTPLVAYLNAKGILGATEVTFWSAEVAVVGALAALNTADRTPAPPLERGAISRDTGLIVGLVLLLVFALLVVTDVINMRVG